MIERSQFEETERSAVSDSLTGLYNRRYFHMAIRREVRRSRRYRPSFSLLMLDLDEFKQVNDEHGHGVGDGVLRRVGRLMRQTVREADVACRYGGDEFAVIAPETDRLGAWALGERIRRSVALGFEGRPTAGRAIRLTVSGGVATYPEDGADAAALVARADETLYGAKRAGRDRVLLHPSERRRATRLPAGPFARVALRRGDGRESRDAVAIDLSRQGALLETGVDLAQQEQVDLLLLEGAGAEQARVIEGKVVRVAPVPSGGRLRVGVAFARPIDDRTLLSEIAWRRAAAAGGRRP